MIFDDIHQTRQGLHGEYHPGVRDGASSQELRALNAPEFHHDGRDGGAQGALRDDVFHILEYEQDPQPSGCQSLQEQCLQLVRFAQQSEFPSKYFQEIHLYEHGASYHVGAGASFQRVYASPINLEANAVALSSDIPLQF
jgi:hypothetical protein